MPFALMQALALVMGKVMPNPPVAPEELTMLRLDNSTTENATAQLAGHELKNFRDGIDSVKLPVKEQEQHVQALAGGK